MTTPTVSAQSASNEPYQVARVVDGRRFAMEAGWQLREMDIAYETWGTLNADASNAILVCHALTGDSHAAGRAGHGHRAEGWWSELIGPGKALDTNRYFIVCSNVLGGCSGTTGPSSCDPQTHQRYGSRFGVVTIRDIVRAQALLATSLGIHSWLAVVGGSMGGMQALEWSVMFPGRVNALVAIATTAAASAQQIAWSMVGRRAITSDPNFCGGDYYEVGDGNGPTEGLKLARQIAQIHYRSEEVFAQRFGREFTDVTGSAFTLEQRFDVEGYLDYHGDKLVNRFDANTYLRLNRAMDLHDIGRGRGGIAKALTRISAPTMVMSIRSDMLYPPYQQVALRDGIIAGGTRCGFYEIDSDDGHDAFLIETQQIARVLEGFFDGIHEQVELKGARPQ